VEPRTHVGLAQGEQLRHLEHHVGQVVDPVGSVRLHAAEGYSLVGGRSADQVLARGGDERRVVSHLGEETPHELRRAPGVETSGGHVTLVKRVQELVEPPEAERQVAVFLVQGYLGDPDRLERLVQRGGGPGRDPPGSTT